MSKLVLKSEDARLAVGGDHEDYELVVEEFVEKWRWGNLYEAIIQDSDNKLWGITYRVQEGDNYYHEFEDVDEVEFYPVEKREVTTVRYVRLKD